MTSQGNLIFLRRKKKKRRVRNGSYEVGAAFVASFLLLVVLRRFFMLWLNKTMTTKCIHSFILKHYGSLNVITKKFGFGKSLTRGMKDESDCIKLTWMRRLTRGNI